MSEQKNLEGGTTPIGLASDIVAAYVSNNKIAADELPGLLSDVFGVVSGLSEDGASYSHSREPAVPINKSVTPDFVICLEDGKKLKMLKRYLRTHYDMSPEDYRRKWGLPADYPMTAPNYAKHRSNVAKQIGLGTSGGARKTTKKKSATKKRVARKKR